MALAPAPVRGYGRSARAGGLAVPGAPDLMAEVRRAATTLWRYRLLLVVTVMLGLVASALFALSVPKEFTASARILVGASNPDLIGTPTSGDALDAVLGNDIIVESEIEVLQSRDLIRRVIEESGLLYDHNFNPRLDWDSDSDDGLISDPVTQALMIQNFLENLWVSPIGRSRIIRVTYTADSPTRAAFIANSITTAYLAMQVEGKQEEAQITINALDERVQELRQDVARAEQDIASLRSENNVPDNGRLAQLGDRIGVLQDRITDSRARLATLSAQRRELMKAISENRLEAPLAFQNAPVLVALRAEKATALSALAQVTATYVPGHPAVLRAQAVVDALDDALAAEFRSTAGELSAEAEAENAVLAELEAVLRELQAEESRVSAVSISIRAIEREAQSAQTLLGTFLNRLAQERELQGTERPDAEIISQAVPPKSASAPNRKLIVAGGIIVSGMLALFLVVVLELSDNRLLTTAQAESWIGAPVLSMLPDLGEGGDAGSAPHAVIVDRPGSAFADAVRALHLAVVPPGSDVPPGVILVTSPDRAEGKSTVAVALGRALALEAGLSSIVVEANREAPRVAAFTGAEETYGLIDHVRDGLELARVVQIDRSTQLQVLRIGSGDPMALRLQDLHIPGVIQALRERYDAVIIDGSGILESADAAAWGSVSDGILLVTALGRSRQTQIATALRGLRGLTDRLLGVVINRG
ncbi:MAG: GumC family protein [Rhodospirillaceae bacterium]